MLAPVGMIMGLANALTQEYLTEKVPWLGNAIFQLTGKRLRHLPMSPERVKTVLT